MTGGDGKDTFVLGNDQGVFYSNTGEQDYALLVDFNPAKDTLKLNGSADDCSIDAIELNGISGIGIFDTKEDLIAIAQGTELNLSAGYVDFV